jgi:hypothetical protein
MQQWEYLIHTHDDFKEPGFFGGLANREQVERKFDELGEQGWELVSMDFPDVMISGVTNWAAVFKRPRTESR